MLGRVNPQCRLLRAEGKRRLERPPKLSVASGEHCRRRTFNQRPFDATAFCRLDIHNGQLTERQRSRHAACTCATSAQNPPRYALKPLLFISSRVD